MRALRFTLLADGPTDAVLSELIEDFGPLRKLSAFATVETDLLTIIQTEGWSGSPESMPLALPG